MMGAGEVDEPKRARRVVVDEAELSFFEFLVVGGIVHLIKGVRIVGALDGRYHLVVHLVGVEPELRLEEPGHVAVQSALRKDFDRSRDVDMFGGRGVQVDGFRGHVAF